jgi:HEAT repeat protein
MLPLLATLVMAVLLDEPARLMEKLRSADVDERDAAVTGLKALGETALPHLSRGTRDPDSEVATRSRTLLNQLVTPKLLRELPDVIGRAEKRDDRAFAGLYLRIVQMTVDPPLGGEDLAVLAGAAVRGATTVEDRRLILGHAVAWKHVLVVPEARKLVSDPSWEVRVSAVWALGELGSKSDLPAITAALQDRDPSVAQQAVVTLTELGVRDSWGKMAPLLESREAGLREAVIRAAGRLRIPEAAPALLARLRAKTGGHVNAARSLAELGIREAVPPLIELLSSQHEEERLAALETLVQLDAKEAVASIRQALKDPRDTVRSKAVWALEWLK